MADVPALFAEYAEAYARGERPQARDYLERAGTGGDELAQLISAWLRAVPAPAPDAEAVALIGALMEADPPLLELRVERGVRVETMVDTLIERLSLDQGKRAKVKRYYQRLEQGLLDPATVSALVWTVLQELLGAGVERAADWAAPAQDLGRAAYLRSAHEVLQPLSTLAEFEEPEPDEIDRLFTGGVP